MPERVVVIVLSFPAASAAACMEPDSALSGRPVASPRTSRLKRDVSDRIARLVDDDDDDDDDEDKGGGEEEEEDSSSQPRPR